MHTDDQHAGATGFALRTHGLTRRFDGGHGVFDLDLRVPAGGVYGFLGPNGAGKTTTIRLALGLLRADAGRVELFGRALSPTSRAPLADVGALVETPSLYPHLSGRGNLDVTATLLGMPAARVGEALERVGLEADAHRRVRDYSLGMRQRLALALALLDRPRLLVLDEPANGLDPAGIQAMRGLLRGFAADGVTVFVSSHLLAEVERVADTVGVLDRGRLVFEGSVAALLARSRARLLLRCDDPARAQGLLADAQAEIVDAETLALDVEAGREAELNRRLVQAGIGVHHLARQPISLESIFLELTRARETVA